MAIVPVDFYGQGHKTALAQSSQPLMNTAPISDIHSFRQRLNAEAKAYILHTELPSAVVELAFEGQLEGRPVVWNACICSIRAGAEGSVEADPKQFIDIHRQGPVYFLRVGLHIEQIDRAAVERTIIMIRKYRNLQLGRHEYGRLSKFSQPE